ncbi:hypothetical protein AOLI_G00064280 [Acnodon oligacanthus]
MFITDENMAVWEGFALFKTLRLSEPSKSLFSFLGMASSPQPCLSRDWTSSEQHSPGGNSKVSTSLDSRATLAKYPLTHPVSVVLFIAPPPPQTPPANEGVSESGGR